MLTAPPEVEVPSSWEPIDPFEGSDSVGQFIPHAAADGRLLVKYFLDKSDGSFKTWAWFGQGAEGAPGRVHGGSVSAILDEALGASVWVRGKPVVTVTLKIRYRNPLPVGTVCDIETTIVRETAKRAVVTGILRPRSGGDVVAEAEAVFFLLPDSELSDKTRAVLAKRRAS